MKSLLQYTYQTMAVGKIWSWNSSPNFIWKCISIVQLSNGTYEFKHIPLKRSIPSEAIDYNNGYEHYKNVRYLDEIPD